MGKNLATMELTMIIASVFRRYEFFQLEGQKVSEKSDGWKIHTSIEFGVPYTDVLTNAFDFFLVGNA